MNKRVVTEVKGLRHKTADDIFLERHERAAAPPIRQVRGEGAPGPPQGPVPKEQTPSADGQKSTAEHDDPLATIATAAQEAIIEHVEQLVPGGDVSSDAGVDIGDPLAE